MNFFLDAIGLGGEDNRSYGVGRVYDVYIVAEEKYGKEVKLTKRVYYPNNSKGPSGSVTESVREADAIRQVKKQKPHLQNVRATRSLGVL